MNQQAQAPAGMSAVGQGIQGQVSPDGKTLLLAIDLTSEGVKSQSGKSMVIATTNGNIGLPGGLQLGVNVFRKTPAITGTERVAA